MANIITEPEVARRLARAIVSDILLYNKEKVKEGIQNDNLFEILSEQLEEGRKLYMQRVDPELAEKTNFYNMAIVDVMIKGCKTIESEIW